MNMDAKLTKREMEIAELFAWGATKKDISNKLFISVRTVENHTRNIFNKIGCTKVTELCAWWFCTRFHISFELSPLKREIITTMLLVLMIPQLFNFDNPALRARKTNRVENVSRRGKDESPVDFMY